MMKLKKYINKNTVHRLYSYFCFKKQDFSKGLFFVEIELKNFFSLMKNILNCYSVYRILQV